MARTARVVAFSTSPEMAEDIDRVATRRGLSRSELLRQAVDAFLGSAASGVGFARETAAPYPASTGAAGASPYGLRRVLASRPAIREICARHGVRRLWLFGSAVRDDFVPGSSDYDFQVEFEPGFDLGPWAGHLFELGQELEALLGERVDVGQAIPGGNPFVRRAIEAERVLVHESA